MEQQSEQERHQNKEFTWLVNFLPGEVHKEHHVEGITSVNVCYHGQLGQYQRHELSTGHD